MGIQGLLPELAPFARRVETHRDAVRGLSLVVDASSWLFKGAYACAFELGTGTLRAGQTPPYVTYWRAVG